MVHNENRTDSAQRHDDRERETDAARLHEPIPVPALSLARGTDVVVLSRSEEETLQLGQALADLLVPGDVVALYGELGAGKTRLVQGICKGLSVLDDVTSPSFTLINEYRGRLPVYHFDFYRLDELDQIAALGVDEYFYDEGVCLIEWAEKAQPLLPVPRLDVFFQLFPEPGRENVRKIELRWVSHRDEAAGD